MLSDGDMDVTSYGIMKMFSHVYFQRWNRHVTFTFLSAFTAASNCLGIHQKYLSLVQHEKRALDDVSPHQHKEHQKHKRFWWRTLSAPKHTALSSNSVQARANINKLYSYTFKVSGDKTLRKIEFLFLKLHRDTHQSHFEFGILYSCR
jgi:hypothetical protein